MKHYGVVLNLVFILGIGVGYAAFTLPIQRTLSRAAGARTLGALREAELPATEFQEDAVGHLVGILAVLGARVVEGEGGSEARLRAGRRVGPGGLVASERPDAVSGDRAPAGYPSGNAHQLRTVPLSGGDRDNP